ncbi:MAG: sn-glycerol-3-phosphate ABC transporter ATP-binding protein UgpC [Planctomycetes bacterium]|nr:sn-glycerol-3-phosphate ABC transporter ATP-binding protein UgpC [Planctomycetota bacterium]
MASVSLQGISKIYPGEVHAVRDLDLEIRDGEFLVLVGPSGCGKSTTLRMIAGLENITEGTLKIGDRVVNDIHPRDRDIAMVFQNYALYPHMTVRDNMAFALKMRKVPKAQIEEQVRWAAEMLGLEPLLGRKPKALSGGQRQRVALGRAIVRKPAVFLFDEPLSNLDAKLRVETRAEIKRLHRELKTTTIYVTHDQEEAMTLGDRVVVMCDGWVRQADSPLNTYRKPADRFVAGFLGMPPMNFLEGYLETVDGKLGFASRDARLRLDEAPLDWLRGESRRPIVAGFRPECLELLDPAEGIEGQTLEATVQITEPLGSTMDVYLQTASGIRLVCRTAASPLEAGKAVAVQVLPENIHLFDPNEQGDSKSPTYYGRNLRVLESRGIAIPRLCTES